MLIMQAMQKVADLATKEQHRNASMLSCTLPFCAVMTSSLQRDYQLLYFFICHDYIAILVFLIRRRAGTQKRLILGGGLPCIALMTFTVHCKKQADNRTRRKPAHSAPCSQPGLHELTVEQTPCLAIMHAQ